MAKNLQLVEFGKRVRDLREKSGFSQEDFAVEADFDRTYYGGVERGERNISALNLIRLAQALKVEVGQLFPPMSKLATLQRGKRG